MHNLLKKVPWAVLLVVIALAIPASSQSPPRSSLRIVSIEEANWSGMCIGYCIFELRIRGTGVRYRERAFPQNRRSIPDKTVKDRITKEKWNRLIGTVDIAALQSYPDRIGCPGCVDEIVQSIEIKFSDGTKKSVFYNLGGQPAPILDLVEEIDSLEKGLREKMKRKYPNPIRIPNPD